MAGSSSTKKAAKLAQRSSGRTVRFQGGTLFPMLVAAILVIGMVLVVYARASRPSASASPPTINDHWHMPYSFYLCDPETGEAKQYSLVGAKEEQTSRGGFVSEEYNRAGVHSHDDELIHWHPFTSAATGNNADLGVFLDVYGVEIDSEGITFPEDQVAPIGNIPRRKYTEENTKCGNEDGEVKVQVWNNFTDTSRGPTYSTAMDDIHMDADGMTFTIGFVPNDVDLPQPNSASQSYVTQYGSADAQQSEAGQGDALPGQVPPGNEQPGQSPSQTQPGTPGSQPGGSTPQGGDRDGGATPNAPEGGAGTESTEPPSTG